MNKLAGANGSAQARIGQRIREAREAAEIDQIELARRLGLSATTMWRYEAGKLHIPTDRLSKIADELRLSVDDLLGREDTQATALALQREILAIAQLGLAAAHEMTPDAIERFHAACSDHYRRTKRR